VKINQGRQQAYTDGVWFDSLYRQKQPTMCAVVHVEDSRDYNDTQTNKKVHKLAQQGKKDV
jgi:hypothetical protein